MPELRIDSLSGLRTIVAGERGSRPGAWLDVRPRDPIDRERDPFAAGHEDRTPPELYTLAGDNGSWRVRVVPNLYPALVPGAPAPAAPAPAPTQAPSGGDGGTEAPDEPAPEEPAPEEPAPEEPAPEEPAPEAPASEQPAPETPAPN